MKFSEKLTKLRKDNNLSQEALAEKLNMSRQAISKWESGNSYPDMSTMINICKVLNCTLEDLLDDDAIGTNNFEKNDKININKWIKDLLDFITKSYNMFWSMKFSLKIRCLVEISIIILILFLAFLLIGTILRETVFEIFTVLPDAIYFYFFKIFKMIYSIFAIALGFIITIHLFKIRYLDYYITIEDNDIKDKIIEKDIREKENKQKNQQKEHKYIYEKQQEKIIIRDPKHTTYSFFTGLAKIIMYILKLFSIILLVPAIITFICLMTCETISLLWFKYGFIFVGIFIAILGLIAIDYDFLEALYNFLFNRKNSLKKQFIIFITGLTIFGIGCGITFIEFTKFNISGENFSKKTTELILDVNNETIFNELEYNKIIIDNKEKDIIVKVNYNECLTPKIVENNENEYFLSYDFDSINIIEVILNDIKNKKIRNYDISYFNIDTITISQDNYNKIIVNNEKYYNTYEE